MGHVTRLEVKERDVEFNSISKENDRLVLAVQNSMNRMITLHNDTDADASDKSDIIALRQKLIDDLTDAVVIP